MATLSDAVAQKIVSALAPVAAAQGVAGPYQQVVPQNVTSFPRLIFQLETDLPQLDTPREAIDVTFSVRVISSVSFKQGDTVLAAADAALDDVEWTITGWSNYWLKREGSTPRLADPREGGGYYYQVGAVYRARFSKEL